MNRGKTHLITASIIFAIIICTYLVMALKFPFAYMIATYEDLVGEWAQVLLFCCTTVLSVRLAFFKSKFRLFFIVLAFAGFYTVMEEISWGQRLFDISTPDFFKKHNLQQETNLHNFLTGPFQTEIKGAIEYLLFAGLMFYGLLFPLLLTCKARIALWVEAKGLPAPPLYLWPFFVTSAFLELGPFNFNEAEIAEILIPLGLTIFLTHYLLLLRKNPPAEPGKGLDVIESNRLSLMICTIFIGVILSSSGITYALYSSPDFKAKVDSRINNGIEKFAGRYIRYEQWGTAVRLYHIIDKKEPNRPSIQRKLALGYNMMGNKEKSDFYINRALDINFRRIENKPSSVSANISQAITYRQINDYQKADFHLQTALKNAIQRVKDKPNSASAAYWLGNTYLEMGEQRQALAQFQRALELNPHEKKYKKAVIKTEIQIRQLSI